MSVSALPQDPHELARRVAESMFAVDTATKDTMQMEILVAEPGRAVLRMEVRPMHLNGQIGRAHV